MKVEHYDEEKGKLLIRNSIWKDRTFKTRKSLEINGKEITHIWGYTKRGQRRILFKHITKFGENFVDALIDEWAKCKGVEAVLSLGIEGDTYQDAFDANFCEEMFEPIFDENSITLGAVYPPNVHTIKEYIQNSKWFGRQFKARKTVGSYFKSGFMARIHDYIYNIDRHTFNKFETVLTNYTGANRPQEIIQIFHFGYKQFRGNNLQEAFDNAFTEDMFEPSEMSNKEEQEFRPNRPAITEATIKILIDNIPYHESCFDIHYLNNQGFKFPDNLYIWIAHNPNRAFKEILAKIRKEAPITFKGILSDLAWDERIKTWTIAEMKSKFSPRMFTDVFQSLQKNPLTPDFGHPSPITKFDQQVKTAEVSKSEPLKVTGSVKPVEINKVETIKIKSNVKISNR